MLMYNEIFSDYICKGLDINRKKLNYMIEYYPLIKYVLKLSMKRSSIVYSKNTPPK